MKLRQPKIIKLQNRRFLP